MINDPGSENYQRNSDFWVGVRLICLSVFALRGGAATHHNPASASPTDTSSNSMWGWLAALRVILPAQKASGLVLPWAHQSSGGLSGNPPG
ncbi:hypothetical protein ACFLXQ_04950 [Chloroflexota bacterium]